MSLERIFEDAFPECYDHNMHRDRPYNGQLHTDHGERGKTEINGVTFRDLRDCFVRACFLSSYDQLNGAGYDQADKGVDAALCENDLYALNFNRIDIVAVAQNLSCEIEKIMGIFPNVPPADRTLDAESDEQLEEYLGKRLDWQVKGKPRGPLDDQSTIRLMLLQAYRLGRKDGASGR